MVGVRVIVEISGIVVSSEDVVGVLVLVMISRDIVV